MKEHPDNRLWSAYAATTQAGHLVEGYLDSGFMLARIAATHFPPAGGVIADVSYNKGTFWKDLKPAIEDGHWTLLASDIAPQNKSHALKGIVTIKKMDFRKLAYANGTIDILILDPPWPISPGKMIGKDFDTRYGTPFAMTSWNAVLREYYKKPMQEAFRVLKPKGLLVVKTGDQRKTGHKVFGGCDVDREALAIGFRRKDRYIMLSGAGKPIMAKHIGRGNFSEFLLYTRP